MITMLGSFDVMPHAARAQTRILAGQVAKRFAVELTSRSYDPTPLSLFAFYDGGCHEAGPRQGLIAQFDVHEFWRQGWPEIRGRGWIEYGTQCRWLLCAGWSAQELLTTLTTGSARSRKEQDGFPDLSVLKQLGGHRNGRWASDCRHCPAFQPRPRRCLRR